MLKNKIYSACISLLFILNGCGNAGVATIEPVNGPQENPATEKFVISSLKNVFNEYDLNGNNLIERKELAEAPDSFTLMDKNKDGVLDFSESMPSADRLQKMTGMIDQFYSDLYKKLKEENSRVSVSALSSSKTEELQPFMDSEEWSRNLKKMSAQSPDGSISPRQFNGLMNNFFLDLAGQQDQYRASGLWSWLKEKFKRKKDTPAVTPGTKPPVILVQGYAEPSWYFLYGIYRNLKKTGRDLYPVNLFPNIGDIREQAKIVAAKIEQAKKERGVAKVDYVAHSMGGLIGRHYIQNMEGANSIDHYVSIATPHYGTYMAWVGIGEAAKQMRPGSEFLTKLNEGNPLRGTIKYTSIWTKTDEIVVPSGNSVLKGSNIMPDVKFVGHLLILWAPKTYNQIRESLDK